MSRGPQILNPNCPTPIKAWIEGVPVQDQAIEQLKNLSQLPIIFKHIAAMPDVHLGIGATVGSVIPTEKAIIPAAVGVDIGCGMMAVRTSLNARDLPENLKEMRSNIEKRVPHGRTHNGGPGDRGAWGTPPPAQLQSWTQLKTDLDHIIDRHPKIGNKRLNHVNHLGTLGTGNHFVEVCLDETETVWFMLHSGSRGVGNRLGNYFIEQAKIDMRTHISNLPDINLAYFQEGTDHFEDYVFAVKWAQNFAKINRELMMSAVVQAVSETKDIPPFSCDKMAINCHHNYVEKELHFSTEVYVTRKGAVSAKKGQLGIIPGSMGAKSYIVRGRGNLDSFQSCSHGAGRAYSRNQAKKKFSIEDHKKATEGVECRKDASVLDETPAAYKSIDQVMRAQQDLVDIVHTLKQIVCVKG